MMAEHHKVVSIDHLNAAINRATRDDPKSSTMHTISYAHFLYMWRRLRSALPWHNEPSTTADAAMAYSAATQLRNAPCFTFLVNALKQATS